MTFAPNDGQAYAIAPRRTAVELLVRFARAGARLGSKRIAGPATGTSPVALRGRTRAPPGWPACQPQVHGWAGLVGSPCDGGWVPNGGRCHSPAPDPVRGRHRSVTVGVGCRSTGRVRSGGLRQCHVAHVSAGGGHPDG